MDKEFKTTFIPKKKLATERKKNIIPSKGNSIVSLLAGLLFVTALVSVIGVYLYKLQVSKTVASSVDSINRAEKAFEPAVIVELKKLDIRLRAATELLDRHVALSDFFASLGESTLPDIAFDNFTFAFNDDYSEVSMSGQSRGFIPIAQQSDLFEKNQYIVNHIFSDFQIIEGGFVSYSLTFALDPDLLSYGRTLQNTQVESTIDDEVVIQNQNFNTVPAGQAVNF